jgi:3'-phosphoadenosine 5'-phosphosulfate sulfotransferase (PAPS reductase)/FAD synthetase
MRWSCMIVVQRKGQSEGGEHEREAEWWWFGEERMERTRTDQGC